MHAYQEHSHIYHTVELHWEQQVQLEHDDLQVYYTYVPVTLIIMYDSKNNINTKFKTAATKNQLHSIISVQNWISFIVS